MAFNRSSSPENYSTPKLSLSKLPSKVRATPVMATPPLSRLASIPFDWEEVPGKPRPDLLPSSTTDCSSMESTTSFPALHDNDHKNRLPVARRLELPPRLLNNSNNAKAVNALSPTTVLDGPYNNISNNYYEIGPFWSQQGQRRRRSFSSLPKGSFRNLLIDHKNKGLEEEEEEEEDGGSIRGGGMSNRYYCDNVIGGRENQRVFKLSSSSSWRWGSFKDNNTAAVASARGDMSPSFSSKNRRGDNNNPSSKFYRVKRKSSFFSFSRSGSNFLSGVYGSLKQAVSWKR